MNFKYLMAKFVTIPITRCSKTTVVKSKLSSTMELEMLDNLMVPFIKQDLDVGMQMMKVSFKNSKKCYHLKGEWPYET